MAFWPSTHASCRAQARPLPQGRCCMMQWVISNGPSTASTASRSVTSSGGRARREPPPPSLAGLHKTGAGELRHHAGEQTARDHGLFGDPVGGHQLAAPRITRKVNQHPQRVTPLAREFELHRSLLSFLSPQEIHCRILPTRVKAFAHASFILTLIMS